jgi:hypothetical protein
MNRKRSSHWLPVLIACFALLTTAAVSRAETKQVAKNVSSPTVAQHDAAAATAFLRFLNPNAKSGGEHHAWQHQSLAGDSCSGSCDCYSCGCYGTYSCCSAGCGACIIIACNAT